MCGRFAITMPPDAMRLLFGYGEHPSFPPRYNIAPTQPIPIVRAERKAGSVVRRFTLVRWGFIPTFVKDPKGFPLLFNARCEGIDGRASFRNASRRRRCLVPANAFYEWRRAGREGTARAQPYLVRRVDGAPMALAGLWETWHGPGGEEVDTACIITTGANGVSAAIHPRLPALIEPKSFATWLDPDETRTDAALALLKPAGNDVLTFVAVGDAVNKVANDDRSVQVPIATPLQAPCDRPDEAQASLF